MFAFGMGLNVIVKYKVSQHKDGKSFVFTILSDEKKVKRFKTEQTFFLEGTTLYKYGFRMFPFSETRNRKWLTHSLRQSVYAKVKKLEHIINKIKTASPEKVAIYSYIFDNALEQCKHLKKLPCN
jgi:deoxyadenosine/deoxycytidine kinase